MTNMKNSIKLFSITSLLYIILSSACSSNSSGGSFATSDTVTVATVKMSDTTTFKKNNGNVCAIYSDATFSYPTSYSDKNSLATLQKLYITYVLDANDTLSLNDAICNCVTNSLHQYDLTQDEDESILNYGIDESEPYLTYHTSTTIQLHYNKNDLVTFCRIDVVKKDSTITSITHKYYTIDLKTMSLVDISNIVRDDAQNQLTALLRSRLLEQNKVENNDQLNELGFYDIDNLIVTSNFFFDESGITWSYLPNKLEVSAVGEPHITLSLDEIKPLICENSIINRIK